MNAEGELYFLEANPNPDISSDEEFASSAGAGGIVYEELELGTVAQLFSLSIVAIPEPSTQTLLALGLLLLALRRGPRHRSFEA